MKFNTFTGLINHIEKHESSLPLIIEELLKWERGDDHEFVSVLHRSTGIKYELLPHAWKNLLPSSIKKIALEKYIKLNKYVKSL